MKDLDRRLAALGHTEIDHDLSALESAVWASVDARGLRPMPNRMAIALCAGIAMLSSGLGAATAAAAANMPLQSTLFTIHPATAPSTILGE